MHKGAHEYLARSHQQPTFANNLLSVMYVIKWIKWEKNWHFVLETCTQVLSENNISVSKCVASKFLFRKSMYSRQLTWGEARFLISPQSIAYSVDAFCAARDNAVFSGKRRYIFKNIQRETSCLHTRIIDKFIQSFGKYCWENRMLDRIPIPSK